MVSFRIGILAGVLSALLALLLDTPFIVEKMKKDYMISTVELANINGFPEESDNKAGMDAEPTLNNVNTETEEISDQDSFYSIVFNQKEVRTIILEYEETNSGHYTNVPTNEIEDQPILNSQSDTQINEATNVYQTYSQEKSVASYDGIKEANEEVNVALHEGNKAEDKTEEVVVIVNDEKENKIIEEKENSIVNNEGKDIKPNEEVVILVHNDDEDRDDNSTKLFNGSSYRRENSVSQNDTKNDKKSENVTIIDEIHINENKKDLIPENEDNVTVVTEESEDKNIHLNENDEANETLNGDCDDDSSKNLRPIEDTDSSGQTETHYRYTKYQDDSPNNVEKTSILNTVMMLAYKLYHFLLTHILASIVVFSLIIIFLKVILHIFYFFSNNLLYSIEILPPNKSMEKVS